MIEYDDTAAIIAWDETGTQFVIKNAGKFVSDVLPQYFRHRSLASFQRQLNYFGFERKKSSQRQNYYYCYAHKNGYFCRDRPHDLLRIRRKTNRGGAKGHHTNKLFPTILSRSCPAATESVIRDTSNTGRDAIVCD